MSELLKDWLLGMTGAAMLLALAENLTPEGGIKRMVSLVGGLVLILTAVSPILKLEKADLADLTGRFEQQASDRYESLKQENDFLFETIIEEKTAAYILDKAKELGMSCRVTVSAAWDGELPVPHTVKLIGSWSEPQKRALSSMIEEELGIPAALQYFEETGQ